MIDPVIQQLKGKLIVSCQAYMGEPLRHPETMAQMARACELGGAGGIRCQGLSDISAIKGRTEVPVIGIWKEGHEGVYITPTLRHARACVAAGADIVAVDATDRPRPDGKPLEDTVRPLKEEGVLVMADCATIEDIRHAFGIPRQARHLRRPRPHARRREGRHGRRRLGSRRGNRHHAPHIHHELVCGNGRRVKVRRVEQSWHKSRGVPLGSKGPKRNPRSSKRLTWDFLF